MITEIRDNHDKITVITQILITIRVITVGFLNNFLRSHYTISTAAITIYKERHNGPLLNVKCFDSKIVENNRYYNEFEKKCWDFVQIDFQMDLPQTMVFFDI